MDIELDRLQKAIVFMLGTMDELAAKNVIRRDGASPLLKNGRKEFEKLKNEGFEPDESEMELALAVLRENGYLEIGSGE